MDERTAWRMTATAAGAVAGVATRSAVTAVWRRVTRDEPPSNPASPTTSWGPALAWAAATGVALGVARLVAQRGAVAAWRTATGRDPEGLETTPA